MFLFHLTKEDRQKIHQILKQYQEDSKVQSMHGFVQHGRTSTYEHCMNVVKLSFWINKHLHLSANERALLTGALLHDFYLYYMLRAGFEPDKIYRIACRTFEGTYDKATILKWLKIFYRRFFAQQFKRSCLPDGPKVGSVVLSPRGDLRMPSDASAAVWMEALEKLEV